MCECSTEWPTSVSRGHYWTSGCTEGRTKGSWEDQIAFNHVLLGVNGFSRMVSVQLCVLELSHTNRWPLLIAGFAAHQQRLLKKGEIEFIGDSGASATFANGLNDFSEYKELDESYKAWTANKGIPLPIKGTGSVFLEHQVDVLGNMVHVRLSPVLYMNSPQGCYPLESGCNKVAHWGRWIIS